MAITQVDLPRVFGAAQQFQANRSQNQLNRLRLDQERQAIETQNQLRKLLPGAVQGNRGDIGQVTALDPDLGLRLQEAERERMKIEAPYVARALQGATPQDWPQIRADLSRIGVNMSDTPEVIDETGLAALQREAQMLMGPQEAPTVKTFFEGGQSVQKQWDPRVGDWVEVGRGDRFKTTPDVVVNNGPGGIDYGDPPNGMVWARNPDGSVATTEGPDGFLRPVAVPIAGGPVETEQENAEKAAANAQEQKVQAGSVVLQDIGRAREKIENAPWWNPATGFLGNLLKDVGGTVAADVQALTQTIRANIGFDRLQAMREASPTGGALGNVTERELADLQAVLGSLSQSQTEEQLLQNLDRLNTLYTGILRKAGAYPNAAEFGFSAPAQEASGGATGEWQDLGNGVRIRRVN